MAKRVKRQQNASKWTNEQWQKDEQQKQKTGIRNERLIGFVLRRQRPYLCSNIHSNRHVNVCVCVCMDIRASALVYNVTSWCVSVYRSVDTIWRKIIFLSLRFVHRGTAFSLCYKVYDVLKHHCIGTEASHPANAIQPMFNVFFSLSIRISCSRDLKLKKDCVCVREREKQRMRLYKCKYIKSVH